MRQRTMLADDSSPNATTASPRAVFVETTSNITKVKPASKVDTKIGISKAPSRARRRESSSILWTVMTASVEPGAEKTTTGDGTTIGLGLVWCKTQYIDIGIDIDINIDIIVG